jgi:hypothetical protein
MTEAISTMKKVVELETYSEMMRNWKAVIREPESGYSVVSCSSVIALLPTFCHGDADE